MLILDKQKAVERVMALTAGAGEMASELPALPMHVRTYQRIATYERRSHAAPVQFRRVVERRRRRMRLVGQSPVL